MPTHIAHICLCLLTHKPTQRQSQKSAIANALNPTHKTQPNEAANPIGKFSNLVAYFCYEKR